MVFQKKYLTSELDAFYHCHRGALMMIGDSIPRGLPSAGINPRRVPHGKRFKLIALVVLSAIKMMKLVHRKTTPKTTPILLSPNYQGISGNKLTIVMSKKTKQRDVMSLY